MERDKTTVGQDLGFTFVGLKRELEREGGGRGDEGGAAGVEGHQGNDGQRTSASFQEHQYGNSAPARGSVCAPTRTISISVHHGASRDAMAGVWRVLTRVRWQLPCLFV